MNPKTVENIKKRLNDLFRDKCKTLQEYDKEERILKDALFTEEYGYSKKVDEILAYLKQYDPPEGQGVRNSFFNVEGMTSKRSFKIVPDNTIREMVAALDEGYYFIKIKHYRKKRIGYAITVREAPIEECPKI